jgi:hypothetical protein
VAATIIAGATTAGFALAVDSGTISACVNSASGTIRIVTADQACTTNEQRLTWNQQGPQGPKGDTGATGATGPQGPAGAPGVSGFEGQSYVFTLFSADHPNGMNGYAKPSDGIGSCVDPGTTPLDTGCTGAAAFPRNCAGVGTFCQVAVYCPTGKTAIGGRYWFDSNNNSLVTGTSDTITSGLTLNIEGAGVLTAQANATRIAGDRFEVRYNTAGIDPARRANYLLILVRCASVSS